MEYNLLENTYLTTNSGIGNVVFSRSQINSLIAGNLSSEMSGSGTTLVLDADLSARVKVSEIRYFFSTTVDRNTVASGITMYHKNEAFEDYSPLYTSLASGYFYATISGSSAPRYVRLQHSITDPTISGVITGFSIINDDTYVDFGEDGTKTSESLHVARNDTEITAIPIYNDCGVTTDAYVSIEPQNTFIDDLLYLSTTANGPWKGLKDEDVIISAPSNWDGNYDNTALGISDHLYITSSSGIGTYTTKIFKDDDNKYSRVNVTTTNPTNAVIATGEGQPSHQLFLSPVNAWVGRYGTTKINYRITIDKSNYSNISSDCRNAMIEFGCFTSSKEPSAGYHSSKYGYAVDGCCIGYEGATPGTFESTPVRVTFNGSNTGTITTLNRFSDPVEFVFDKNKNTVVSYYNYYNDWSYSIPYSAIPTGVTGWYRVDTATDLSATLSLSGYTSATKNYCFKNIHVLNNDVDEINDNDGDGTIQIRSSKTAPIKYKVYRKFYPMEFPWIVDWGTYSHAKFLFKDYSIPDNTEVYDSYYNDENSVFEIGSTQTESQLEVHDVWRQIIDYDVKTGNIAGILYTNITVGANRRNYLQAFMWNNVTGITYDNQLYVVNASTETSGIILQKVCLWSGGVWVAWYNGNDNNGDGYYYLRHYDATFTNTYTYYKEEEFMYDCDVDYETGYLWYSNNANETVTLIDRDGEVVSEYIYGDGDYPNPKGVASDNNGGCWFINGVDLYHIDSDGELVASLTGVGTTANLMSYLELDGSDGFWVLEGEVMLLVDTTGRILRTAYVEYAETFRAIDSGVLITCSDEHQRFVDKTTMTVTMDLDDYGHVIPIEYDYTQQGQEKRFPLSYDTHWQGLEWNDVNLGSYELPEESFHQVKVTLRGVSNTPELEGIYINRNVEISDIPYSQSKNIYLKTEVPDEDLTVGSYDSNLRVWLNKPIN